MGLRESRMSFMEDLAELTSITDAVSQRRVKHASCAMEENTGRRDAEGKENAELSEGCCGDADRAGSPRKLDRERIGELKRAEEGGPGRQQGAETRGAQQNQRIGEAKPHAQSLDGTPERQRVWHIKD